MSQLLRPFWFYNLANANTKFSCLTDKVTSKSEAKLQPSLRRDKQQNIEAEYGLNATPEFKSFVAKKLADAMDR